MAGRLVRLRRELRMARKEGGARRKPGGVPTAVDRVSCRDRDEGDDLRWLCREEETGGYGGKK